MRNSQEQTAGADGRSGGRGRRQEQTAGAEPAREEQVGEKAGGKAEGTCS